MTDHEQIDQLQTQLAQRDQTIASLRQTIGQQEARLGVLEGQRHKDSHNSSKPPSSDGLRRRPHSQRPVGTKATGGQPGHPGHTLRRAATPDAVVTHRPNQCGQCQQGLEGVAGVLAEERQVDDLPPPIRMEVTAHRVEQVRCPHCGHLTAGMFPAGILPGVQYGPELRSVAVYLHHYQFLSMERTIEALQDLYQVTVSEGALAQWLQAAATRVGPTVERIKDLVATRKRIGGDETGIRVANQLGWLHVASTRWLTHLAWHRKRGQVAMRAIGIWPRFHGQAMRDRWASYDTFACHHRLCKAHLIRDLAFLAEVHEQPWAALLRDLFLDRHAAAQEWHARGVARLPDDERTTWQIQYFELVSQGLAALPSPEPVPKRPKKGRPKQHPAKNLLDVLLRRADQSIGFVEDTTEEFTNNRREQDIRHEKVAGGFRSEAGATVFCALRSYVATLRKQGHRAFAAIRSLFRGPLIPVAWGLE